MRLSFDFPLALLDPSSLEQSQINARLMERYGIVSPLQKPIHDDSNKWYYAPKQPFGTALVFDTRKIYHGAIRIGHKKFDPLRKGTLEAIRKSVDARVFILSPKLY